MPDLSKWARTPLGPFRTGPQSPLLHSSKMPNLGLMARRGSIKTPNCNNFKFLYDFKDNVFVKSELNKKQQIIKKLLSVNCNQLLDYEVITAILKRTKMHLI